MATQRRGPARRDRGHDALLAITEMIAVRLPERRKSATSRAGAMTPAQTGGATSRRSRSSGLGVALCRSV